MPPVRTASMSSSSIAAAAAKPMKTERTHEENQERAYIAASRRSDRSLEARVESARRASEIHKRRTGRSLRVTEQDVINEEMYEEEDDDLPMQYRRLTAHLHTSNAEFDRRLAAYLTNHVAMRAALGQATGLQNQSYPNAAQFASNQSPAQTMSTFSSQSLMGPPQSTSPTCYNQPTFASPRLSMKSPTHNRSASLANANNFVANMGGNGVQDRRNSMPLHSSPSRNEGQPAAKRLKSIHNLKLENLPKMDVPTPPHSESTNSKSPTPQPNHTQPLRPSEFPAPFDPSLFSQTNAALQSMPFSTTLPVESQHLLSGAFDPSDPMTSMLMGSSSMPMQSNYGYDSGSSKYGYGKDPSFSGMDQTLAPGFLDTSVSGFDMGMDPSSAFDSASPFATSAGGFGSGFDDMFRSNIFTHDAASGQVSPAGDREWQNFIDGNVWDDSSSQPNA
ncbi:hypothetical protein K461DRAFT_15949 [Myriangium duriaei CBS 260.36]|uniref:Uncharacterized protein n=1 Tax=Myriangium duriaei CBS 260.36 TaxID=1168546 RepID=A0A9P4J9L1_9PEZI|nr:hypothetical protein K461DRAFT_15949 [Myriangium duriaei CBS 260.36]